VGEKMKKIKFICKTTSENPNCHMYIPQSRNNIYVLNIIIQNILDKKKLKKGTPKENPK
jgi:hypothetical protein